MVGVGFAWASILSLPYALLSDSVPAEKMGVYMGIFNFFIVIPQLVAASLLGFLLKTFFGGQPIHALVIGGVSLIVAGLCVLRVREPRAATLATAQRRTETHCRMHSKPCRSPPARCPPLLLARPPRSAAAAANRDAVDTTARSNRSPSEAVYFVVTDRFVNGDPANDQRDQGGPDPATRSFDRPVPGPNGESDNIGYLGGDFKGVLDNAGYIRDMGFTRGVDHADRRPARRGLHRRQAGQLGQLLDRPGQDRLPRLLGRELLQARRAPAEPGPRFRRLHAGDARRSS